MALPSTAVQAWPEMLTGQLAIPPEREHHLSSCPLLGVGKEPREVMLAFPRARVRG